MRTAIDTNVISALWSHEPSRSSIAAALASASQEGGLAIAAPVYAELLAYPGASAKFIDAFLNETGIVCDFSIPEPVWREAGRRFALYCERRRRAKGAGPKRLLVDFLIGTHALLMADQLLTLDRHRYQPSFPDLRQALSQAQLAAILRYTPAAR
ncbi:MAG: type II toxin-antitoxin system VapC family toxin [Acidobacteria bacterium]|nr:type II toxin-antitoxin system VapC family toxin [Acidobacteriota bacterium]